jgi:hypothetical protein
VVFEGIVEIDPSDGAYAPLAVRAGEMAEYGRGRHPERRQSPAGMNEKTWEERGSRMMDGNRTSGGEAGRDGSTAGQSGQQSGQQQATPHGGGGGKRP